MKRKYLLKKDPVDERDLLCAVMPSFHLPASADLRPLCPPIADQGQLGSCSANAAVAGVWDFLQLKELRAKAPANEAVEEFDPSKFVKGSRLFLYYNERLLEGTVDQDAGACLRDGVKALHQFGCCPEDMLPYDIDKFTEKPSDECYAEAKKHTISEYSRIVSLRQMKTVLAEGYPFVIGIQIYESFESEEVAKTGMVPMPDVSKEQCQGGHAVCVVGFDDAKQLVTVRNSWGPDWGDKGHFYLPYEFVTNPDLTSDCWMIKR